MTDLNKRLADRHVTVKLDPKAKEWVAEKGYDPIFGARPLKRAIQSQLENPLAKAILEGRFAAKDTIRVACEGGVMNFVKG